MKYYPPVPEAACTDMLLGLFSSKKAFAEIVAPGGTLRRPFLLLLRPELAWEYKWYRIRRLLAARRGQLPGERNIVPMSIDEYLRENLTAVADTDTEVTLVLAWLVLSIFEYPHAVFDRDGWAYRLRVAGSPSWSLQVHDYMGLPKIAYPKRHAADFLSRFMETYELFPKGSRALHGSSGVRGYMGYNVTAIADPDFAEAFRFLFRYLRENDYDWDFGSLMYVFSDDWFYEEYADGDKAEDAAGYDPHASVLADLEMLGKEKENLDFPYENVENEIEEFDRELGPVYGSHQIDHETMMLEMLDKQQVIGAYRDVYGREPLNLPETDVNALRKYKRMWRRQR